MSATATVTPFLMFTGQAEAAMRWYVDVFADAEIERLERFGAGEAGAEGSVKQAVLRIGEQRVRFFDSPVEHTFGFTPAISLFTTCATAAEVDELFRRLADGGSILMPLAAYPFNDRFGWVDDRFGVSWQIALSDADS